MCTRLFCRTKKYTIQDKPGTVPQHNGIKRPQSTVPPLKWPEKEDERVSNSSTISDPQPVVEEPKPVQQTIEIEEAEETTVPDIVTTTPIIEDDSPVDIVNEDSSSVDIVTPDRKEDSLSVDIHIETGSINGRDSETEINPEPPVEIRIDEERRPGVIPLSVNFDEVAEDDIEKHAKLPEDDQLIREAIERNEFLNKILKDKLLKQVVDAMYNREIKAKEVIIHEGEKGSHMYVSAKGTFEVHVKGKGIVNTFDDVRVFGEMAILYNAKRNATIKATKAGRVWVLDRSVYQKLMVRFNIKEQDEMLTFLKEVPVLNKVGEKNLQKVTNLLKVKYFPPGSTIIKQGEKGDKFYIIRAGTVTITREGEGVVNNFGKSQFFGERALLKDEVRAATVTSDAPGGVECLILKRQHFINHFGELTNEGLMTTETEETRKVSEGQKNKRAPGHRAQRLEDHNYSRSGRFRPRRAGGAQNQKVHLRPEVLEENRHGGAEPAGARLQREEPADRLQVQVHNSPLQELQGHQIHLLPDGALLRRRPVDAPAAPEDAALRREGRPLHSRLRPRGLHLPPRARHRLPRPQTREPPHRRERLHQTHRLRLRQEAGG